MTLSKETVKRIEEEANSYAGKYNIASIASMVHVGYMAGATAEATRSMIVEAGMDKTIQKQDETINTYYDLNNSLGDKIRELTSERDAYKEALEKFVDDYTDLLWEYSQQISLNEGQVKEWLSKKYTVKSVLNQFNNTENEKEIDNVEGCSPQY